MWNKEHGGQDGWRRQDTIHEHDHDYWCDDSRYHARGYSTTADNHKPSFGQWSPWPVHFDESGHAAKIKGIMDHVDPEIRSSPKVTSSFKVYAPGKDCGLCTEWDGYVWMYKVKM